MSEPLRILLLEGDTPKVTRILQALRQSGFETEYERPTTAAGLERALSTGESWDAVISAYALPRLGALDALEIVRASGRDLPFLVIAGPLEDDRLVAAMRAGVHDCLPEGDLARLGEAIRRERAAARGRAEQRQAVRRVAHLNRVLRAIRNVNQLIVREKDPVRLVEQACELLVETRGYVGAWIRWQGHGELPAELGQCGWGQPFGPFADRIRSGWSPPCVRTARSSEEGLAVMEPQRSCTGCPLHDQYHGNRGVAVLLRQGGTPIGALGVSFPAEFPVDEEEQALLQEVAADLAFALADLGLAHDRAVAQAETTALLEASRAVLSTKGFEETARRIFVLCKEQTGATAGYVALREGEDENALLYLDTGGEACTVDPSLPMPIRGLRAEAHARAEAVFDNDFAASDHAALLPEGHAPLHNALFAPIVVDDTVQGIIGLANKPAPFTQDDARRARALGEIAAIALEKAGFLDDLQEKENRFRTYVDSAPTGIIIAGGTGRYIDANPQACQMLGYSPEELLSRSIAEVCHPDDLPRAYAAFKELKAHDRAEGEFTLLRGDGSPISVRIQAVSLPGGRFMAFHTDITERKRDEERLRLQAMVLDQIEDRVTITDLEGRVSHLNQAACRMLGRTAESLIGEPISTFGEDPRRGATQEEILRHTLENGSWTGEVVNWQADGTAVVLHTRTTVVRDEKGEPTALCEISTDVTPQKQAEQRLRRHERLLRFAIEQMPVPVIIAEGDEVVISHYNQPTLDLLAVPDSGPPVDPHRIPLHRHRQFWPTFHPDGTPYDIDDLPLTRALKERVTTRNREIIIRHEDRDHWVLANAAPLLDEAGEVVAGIVVFPEITDLKEKEARILELEQQVQRAQRLESVGRLAGGIAHDFNNLLTVVNNHADTLLTRFPPDNPSRELVLEIRNAGRHAARLTGQLLAFSRRQVMKPRNLDLNEVVRNLQTMLQRLIREDVALEFALADDLGTVHADPVQLEQVLINLAVNARDAMPDGGNLTIRTDNVEIHEEETPTHLNAGTGPHVRLSVTDDGTGLTEEVRENLFEPFFTTKPTGEGTGLGLSIVHGIVKQSGGFVSVQSEPGRGTSFRVHLPRVEGRPAQPPPPASDPVDHSGSETILVVEDERSVRRVAQRILASGGYQVLTAATGKQALEVYRNHEAKIHLLVTDVVMPGMSGKALADELSEGHPDCRVLYMSGYTDNVIARRGVLDPGVHFVSKPFDGDDLLEAVRRALDGEPRAGSGSSEPERSPVRTPGEPQSSTRTSRTETQA